MTFPVAPLASYWTSSETWFELAAEPIAFWNVASPPAVPGIDAEASRVCLNFLILEDDSAVHFL